MHTAARHVVAERVIPSFLHEGAVKQDTDSAHKKSHANASHAHNDITWLYAPLACSTVDRFLPQQDNIEPRLCFQQLCLPFRPLPYLTWPITCGNSTGLNDPTFPRLPPTLLPFRKQEPRSASCAMERISLGGTTCLMILV